jgi:ribonuclease P protein component
VVASRRSFPTAVARNRARRRLREVFRLSRSALRAGVDMVLVARPRILDAPFDAVRADFRSVCVRLGIWENRT